MEYARQSQNIFRNEDTGYNCQASQLLTTIDTFKKTERDELAANASYDYKFNKMRWSDYNGKLL
jgi:hypothetical protein